MPECVVYIREIVNRTLFTELMDRETLDLSGVFDGP